MLKDEFVAKVAEKTGLTKAAAAKAVDAFAESVTETLSAGDSISLTGFGKFSTSERAARTGRNPQTGASIKIPASTVAKFTPGKALKDAVNAGKKKGKKK